MPMKLFKCKHNKKKLGDKKKPTCTKLPQPGATQGNCPFDGAMVSVGAITDAVHLVHGAVACTHNPWATHGSLSSGSKTEAWNPPKYWVSSKHLYQFSMKMHRRKGFEKNLYL